MSPEVCPHCGAEVPRDAKVCPECGADEQTGWSDEAHAAGLGLPDDEFDYDEFVKDEFGTGRNKPRGITWFWWAVALLLIGALLFLFVR